MNETRPESMSAFWMPFTNNRDFKANPRLLVSAEGMYYKDVDGNAILDGTAGLWCVPCGHAQPQIVGAIREMVGQLDFAPTFQMGHPAAFELAEKLMDYTGHKFGHVFYTNSGSEAVDTALKIALAYHKARGEGGRTRLIGRERGYHGVGFGGISVGGIGGNRKTFGPLLPGVDHLPHTHNLDKNAYTVGEPEYGTHLADELERIVALKLERIRKRFERNHQAVLSYDEALVKAIASRCTEVDSGARNIDNILSKTLMPELAQRVLERMAQDKPIQSLKIELGSDGDFAYSLC